MAQRLQPQSVPMSAIPRWLQFGWHQYRQAPLVATLYAFVYFVVGMALMAAVLILQAAPMIYALAGGFMLVGPAAGVGWLAMTQMQEQGARPRLVDCFSPWRNKPGLWVLTVVSIFLWLIWITDAAILYGLYFGDNTLIILPRFGFTQPLPAFVVFSSMMGGALALAVFLVLGFSTPLVADGRAGLPEAVGASVRAVLGNFQVLCVWAGVLTLLTMSAIALPPLLLLAFPLVGYASVACYRQVFPGV